MSEFDVFKDNVAKTLEANRLAQQEEERKQREEELALVDYRKKLAEFFAELKDELVRLGAPTLPYEVGRPPVTEPVLVKPMGVFRKAVYKDVLVPVSGTIFSEKGWRIHGGEAVHWSNSTDFRGRSDDSGTNWNDEIFMLTSGELGVRKISEKQNHPQVVDHANKIFSNGRTLVHVNSEIAFSHLMKYVSLPQVANSDLSPVHRLITPYVAPLLNPEV